MLTIDDPFYPKRRFGKKEFALVLCLGWTSVAQDKTWCEKVLATKEMWEDEDPSSELHVEFRGLSARKLFEKARKALRREERLGLEEMTVAGKGKRKKRKKIVKTKWEQLEARK
ncbi:hypothetical protein JB92DRAFT_3117364 [Gautieria morchelliformis]|nr:hypothetical protein JB92DRAFT_3117364 [Gautieria morchelliformis]